MINPATGKMQTVLITGQCDCDCHKPGVYMMHCMPCCHPTYEWVKDEE